MRKVVKTFTSSLLITCAGGFVVAAASTDDASSASADTQLTVIVVTAGRWPDRWEDTALTVTVLAPDKLEASGVIDTSDPPRVAPGLEYGNSGGRL